MKNLLPKVAIISALTSGAFAGGWETGKLDNSFMYQEGNYAEFGLLSVNYDVGALIQYPLSTKANMANDQTRTGLAIKMELDKFDIGLTRYHSGAIQLNGQGANIEGCNPATAAVALCSVVPSADVTIYSTAFLARYEIDDNISVLAGLNNFGLSDSSVTTIAGHYEVKGKSRDVPVFGAAYERSDIALRIEALVQSETETSLEASSSLSPLIPTTAISGAKYTIPQTMTINFQSGIAEDTLLFGSIHRQAWDNAQILIPKNLAGINPDTGASDAPVSEVGSSFSDKTAYSLGIGRKISDTLSLSASLSMEEGSGPTTDDPFTLSDGSMGITIGGRYTKDNMTISAGFNRTNAGDVKVIHEVAPGVPSGLTADYADNSTTAFGIKVGFKF